MDWQPTTNNPNGVYYDAGPVVVGIATDGGGGQNLQVTGATSLDGGLILTDGGGNLMTTDGGYIVATDASQDSTCTLVSISNVPQLSLISKIAEGAAPATIALIAAKDLHIQPGIDDASSKGNAYICPLSGYKAIIGTNTAGGSVLRVVGLPTGAGTPPGGLSAGDLWVDTTAGSHQGILKVY